MTTPPPVQNLLQRANALVGRNVLYIAIGVFLLGLLGLAMVNYYGDKVEQAVLTNPPLTKREAKKIVARSRADSTKAVLYKRVAIIAIHQADSARHEARQALHQADSLRTQYEAIAPDPSIPLSVIEQRLSTYTSPDTSAY